MNEVKPKAVNFPDLYILDDLGGTSYQAAVSPLSWVDSRSGDSQPRYKSIIAAGGNASTNFFGLKSEILIDTGCEAFVTYTLPNGTSKKCIGRGYTTNKPRFGVAPGPSVSADNVALGKFYSKARQAQTSFQGMVFLGELRETLALIRHPSERLVASARSLMDLYANLIKRYKGRRLGSKQLQQELSSLYLEGVFGWAPLLNDVEDALKAYDKLMKEGPQSIMVRGFGNEAKTTGIAAGSENIYTSNFNFKYSTQTVTESQVLYYGKVRGNVSGGASVDKALSLTGFKASEFVPTLWELLPWSFLIDYFTNIGDIVSAATFVQADIAWCSKTVRSVATVSRNGSYDRKSSGANSNYVAAGGGSYAWITRFSKVTRTADVTPGIPGLEFSLPGSNAKWANIAALVLQGRAMSSALSRLIRN